MSETNSDCKFYDWNSNPNYPSYPSVFGARCHKHDKFFSKSGDGKLEPSCATCEDNPASEEYTCSCGDEVSHKDSNTCLACAIDATEEY